MILHAITITGADDNFDIDDMARLSAKYPWVEWGILLSEKRMGTPRYPSSEWVNQVAPRDLRLCGHLCGPTCRSFMGVVRWDANPQWLRPWDMVFADYNRAFARTQLNFNAQRANYSVDDITNLNDSWFYDGTYITQHNQNNHWVWQVPNSGDLNNFYKHQILHDASGGAGLAPSKWHPPIAGMLNGYAGGIGPDNVIDTLSEIANIIGEGFCWIDMESGVRVDDQLDVSLLDGMLGEIDDVGKTHGWL